MGERLWPTGKIAYEVLVRAARKLELDITEGARHTILEQIHTGKKTTVPRHAEVKQGTTRSIVRFWILEMGIPESEVMEALGIKQKIVPKTQQ